MIESPLRKYILSLPVMIALLFTIHTANGNPLHTVRGTNNIHGTGFFTDTSSAPRADTVMKKDTLKRLQADQMPRFPGTRSDEESMQQILYCLRDHITYPAKAVKHSIQGTVHVQFIVEEDGQLSDVKTVGPLLGGGLEKEAAGVIKGMPRWIPGIQKGKPISVSFSIPVKFRM